MKFFFYVFLFEVVSIMRNVKELNIYEGCRGNILSMLFLKFIFKRYLFFINILNL